MAKNEKNHTNTREDQNSFRNIIAGTVGKVVSDLSALFQQHFPSEFWEELNPAWKHFSDSRAAHCLVSLQLAAMRLSINVNCGGYPRDGDTSTGNCLEPIRLILHRLLKSYQMVSVLTHCYSWTNNEKNHMQTYQWLLYDFAPTAFPHFLFDYHGCFIGRVCSQHSLRTIK